MDDPARLAAWRCVQFNCHNGIWNEIGAMWCWKGCRNIHFGSLAFTLGRENFSKSLCRQCQLSLRTPRIAGDAFVLVGSGKASPWSDLTPWGCECGKVGHASFRTSKRRGEQGLAQRKCWASCPQKLILVVTTMKGSVFCSSSGCHLDGLVLVGWCWQHHCTVIMESGSQVLPCPCHLVVHPVFFQARPEISCYWLIKAFMQKTSYSYNLSEIITVWQTLFAALVSLLLWFSVNQGWNVFLKHTWSLASVVGDTDHCTWKNERASSCTACFHCTMMMWLNGN